MIILQKSRIDSFSSSTSGSVDRECILLYNGNNEGRATRKGIRKMAGTAYLVDFENVHTIGLNGIGYLNSSDSVYLFFTDATSRLNLALLADTWVTFIPKQ